MQENLKEKYGITDEQIKRAVDQINFGKIACDGSVLIAICDLVLNGDIEPINASEKTTRESELEDQIEDLTEQLEVAKLALNLVCYDIETDNLTEEAKESEAVKKAVEDLQNAYLKEATKCKEWL